MMPDESHNRIRTKLASHIYYFITIIKVYFVSFVQFFCVCLDVKIVIVLKSVITSNIQMISYKVDQLTQIFFLNLQRVEQLLLKRNV